MKSRILPLLAVAVSVTVAQPSFADGDKKHKGKWFLKPGAISMDMDNKRELEDEDVGGSVGFEYQWCRWGTELQLWRGVGANEKNIVPDSEVAFSGGAINQYLYLRPKKDFRPYFVLGAGRTDIDFENKLDDEETHASLGLGFQHSFTENARIWADVRNMHGFDDSIDDVVAGVGLALKLTRGSKSLKPMSSTAADPNMDDDNDGVINAKDACPGTVEGVDVNRKGCATADDMKVADLQLEVKFELGSSELKSGQEEIKKLAAMLKEDADLDVVVEGHTDSSGPEEYNKWLSTIRAKAVATALVEEHGISADRITSKGYGESKPQYDNATREGRKKNRRVVASIVKTSSGK